MYYKDLQILLFILFNHHLHTNVIDNDDSDRPRSIHYEE